MKSVRLSAISSLLLLTLLPTMWAACRSRTQPKATAASKVTAFEQHLTSADSTAVVALVDSFFTSLKDERFH